MNAIAQTQNVGSPKQNTEIVVSERWGRLPIELRALPQWVLAGADKVPRKLDGSYADTTDPTTWTDFPSACRAAAQRSWDIGFVLTASDPYTCIDLDVKNASSHPDQPKKWTKLEQLERHQSIIVHMDSYTERSRSGLGCHIWVRGNIGAGRNRDGVEVYSQEHFLICTGDVLLDRPVADRQEFLLNLVSRMEPPAPEIMLAGPDRADEAIAERATGDQGKLGRLWRGEWCETEYDSQSDADLALVKMLVPLTASPRECWATFRLSELGKRPKAARLDYMKGTLACAVQHLARDAQAIRHGGEVAEALRRSFLARGARPKLRLLMDSDLDRLPQLRWLVKGVIPDAGIGAIYGDSGTFKSFLTLDLLAHISNGREWFGHRVKGAPAVYVPFEGQGGVPNRIKAWRMAQTASRCPGDLATFEADADVLSNISVVMEPLNLRESSDRDALVATLLESGWAGGILCIDTLAQAAAGIEENSSAMGEMIAIFRDLQHRLGGVILIVHHSGKDQSRGMRGWSGLHAAMDFVVECQKEGEAEAREAQFKLSKVKDGSTGASFGFRMQLVPLGFDEDGDPITSLTVCPVEPSEKSEHPFRIDEVQEAADDDTFIDRWVRCLMSEGKQPTLRGLEGQLGLMKAQRRITQKRIRDAVARLKQDGRLTDAPGGPGGSKWLRAIDAPQGGA